MLHRLSAQREALVRAGDLLEKVGLPPRRARDYPHELSGGQKQRVMIAMALACTPSLIIADEPTTALDVMVQAQVLTLLNELQHEMGLAMLFITHDLSVLVEVCDRLAIMYAGKIVEEGPSAPVFAKPAHPYTEALAAAFPSIGDLRFRRSPSGLGGDPPQPDSIPSGCSFHPRCPVAFDECPTVIPDLYRPESDERRHACWYETRLGSLHERGRSRPRASNRRGRSGPGGPRPPRVLRGPGRPRRRRGRQEGGHRARGRRCRPDASARRGARAGGRVRVREDDAGAHDHGTRTTEAGRDPLRGRAPGQEHEAPP